MATAHATPGRRCTWHGAADARGAGLPMSDGRSRRILVGMSDRPDEPLFRVVRGTPTAEELAALFGAVVSRSRAIEPDVPRAVSAWVTSARPGAFAASGLPGTVGAGAWRRSALPR